MPFLRWRFLPRSIGGGIGGAAQKIYSCEVYKQETLLQHVCPLDISLFIKYCEAFKSPGTGFEIHQPEDDCDYDSDDIHYILTLFENLLCCYDSRLGLESTSTSTISVPSAPETCLTQVELIRKHLLNLRVAQHSFVSVSTSNNDNTTRVCRKRDKLIQTENKLRTQVQIFTCSLTTLLPPVLSRELWAAVWPSESDQVEKEDIVDQDEPLSQPQHITTRATTDRSSRSPFKQQQQKKKKQFYAMTLMNDSSLISKLRAHVQKHCSGSSSSTFLKSQTNANELNPPQAVVTQLKLNQHPNRSSNHHFINSGYSLTWPPELDKWSVHHKSVLDRLLVIMRLFRAPIELMKVCRTYLEIEFDMDEMNRTHSRITTIPVNTALVRPQTNPDLNLTAPKQKQTNNSDNSDNSDKYISHRVGKYKKPNHPEALRREALIERLLAERKAGYTPLSLFSNPSPSLYHSKHSDSPSVLISKKMNQSVCETSMDDLNHSPSSSLTPLSSSPKNTTLALKVTQNHPGVSLPHSDPALANNNKDNLLSSSQALVSSSMTSPSLASSLTPNKQQQQLALVSPGPQPRQLQPPIPHARPASTNINVATRPNQAITSSSLTIQEPSRDPLVGVDDKDSRDQQTSELESPVEPRVLITRKHQSSSLSSSPSHDPAFSSIMATPAPGAVLATPTLVSTVKTTPLSKSWVSASKFFIASNSPNPALSVFKEIRKYNKTPPKSLLKPRQIPNNPDPKSNLFGRINKVQRGSKSRRKRSKKSEYQQKVEEEEKRAHVIQQRLEELNGKARRIARESAEIARQQAQAAQEVRRLLQEEQAKQQEQQSLTKPSDKRIESSTSRLLGTTPISRGAATKRGASELSPRLEAQKDLEVSELKQQLQSKKKEGQNNRNKHVIKVKSTPTKLKKTISILPFQPTPRDQRIVAKKKAWIGMIPSPSKSKVNQGLQANQSTQLPRKSALKGGGRGGGHGPGYGHGEPEQRRGAGNVQETHATRVRFAPDCAQAVSGRTVTAASGRKAQAWTIPVSGSSSAVTSAISAQKSSNSQYTYQPSNSSASATRSPTVSVSSLSLVAIPAPPVIRLDLTALNLQPRSMLTYPRVAGDKEITTALSESELLTDLAILEAREKVLLKRYQAHCREGGSVPSEDSDPSSSSPSRDQEEDLKIETISVSEPLRVALSQVDEVDSEIPRLEVKADTQSSKPNTNLNGLDIDMKNNDDNSKDQDHVGQAHEHEHEHDHKRDDSPKQHASLPVDDSISEISEVHAQSPLPLSPGSIFPFLSTEDISNSLASIGLDQSQHEELFSLNSMIMSLENQTEALDELETGLSDAELAQNYSTVHLETSMELSDS